MCIQSVQSLYTFLDTNREQDRKGRNIFKMQKYWLLKILDLVCYLFWSALGERRGDLEAFNSRAFLRAEHFFWYSFIFSLRNILLSSLPVFSSINKIAVNRDSIKVLRIKCLKKNIFFFWKQLFCIRLIPNVQTCLKLATRMIESSSLHYWIRHF